MNRNPPRFLEMLVLAGIGLSVIAILGHPAGDRGEPDKHGVVILQQFCPVAARGKPCDAAAMLDGMPMDGPLPAGIVPSR